MYILRLGDATTHIENSHFLFKSHLNVNWHILEWKLWYFEICIPFYSPFTNNLTYFCSKMAFLRGNRAPEFPFSIQILYENFLFHWYVVFKTKSSRFGWFLFKLDEEIWYFLHKLVIMEAIMKSSITLNQYIFRPMLL